MSEKEAGNVVTSANAEEFYANRLGLAEEAPVEAVTEQEITEPTETAEDQSEQPTEETEIKATEEKKQNPKLEKRFSELTKQREEARKEAQRERESREALETRLRELEEKTNPQPEAIQADVKPKPEQFTDAFEYAEALAEWSADQALRNRDQQELQRKAQEEQQKLVQSWQTRLEAVKADLPDYDEMIASASDVQVTDAVRDAMLESEQGPRILYHLAENPELAEKLKSMSMISALREIGKLEARFEAKSTKTDAKTEAETKPSVARSKAPAPISPIRASSAVADVGVGSDGEFHGSYQQWRESRKAGKIR
ncbi:hypothetical protein UFOVP96_57 [uncultured Caudovirales phage]|uniref:Scaffolding protein n=1 Tax=uncultured Caudovirales phage TaxID=2100421 RepID=A0A6J5KZ67_9CAUD|nr:hypothetical protein UFOVP96_57 [uncultured Caudovirales phage]